MAGRDRKRRRAMYDTILKLSSYQECCDFFDDLCTGKELEALEQRFEVARMLAQGKVYMDIMKETGASSATISRVKRVFSDGTGCMLQFTFGQHVFQVSAANHTKAVSGDDRLSAIRTFHSTHLLPVAEPPGSGYLQCTTVTVKSQ